MTDCLLAAGYSTFQSTAHKLMMQLGGFCTVDLALHDATSCNRGVMLDDEETNPIIITVRANRS